MLLQYLLGASYRTCSRLEMFCGRTQRNRSGKDQGSGLLTAKRQSVRLAAIIGFMFTDLFPAMYLTLCIILPTQKQSQTSKRLVTCFPALDNSSAFSLLFTSCTFSRAFYRLHVTSTSSDWCVRLFSFIAIG